MVETLRNGEGRVVSQQSYLCPHAKQSNAPHHGRLGTGERALIWVRIIHLTI